MFRRTLAVLTAVIATVWMTIGCSTLITAYLVDQLLNNKAPTHIWSGDITDQSGRKLADLTVKIAATTTGDTKVVTYDGTTDADGHYSIKFRWSDKVDYTLKVLDADSNMLYTHDFNSVTNDDMSTDITITGSVGVELSGVVSDASGAAIPGALVIAATTDSLLTPPVMLKDSASDPIYTQTNDAGTFTLKGTLNTYGIVCVFEPGHGFAYNYGSDSDHNGQIAVNVKMGGPGRYSVDAQVVDSGGLPISNKVLSPGQQFRVRCSEKFNLSDTVDKVVLDNALFPSLVTKPSVQQPPDFTFLAAATGNDGIALGLTNELGGVYTIDLLSPDTDTQATALVTSGNPLVLADNAVIVVRVN